MTGIHAGLERNVKVLSDGLYAGNGSTSLAQDQKQEMLQAAKAIVQELQDPIATVMGVAMGPFMSATLRTAIGAGILDALPSNGE